VLRSQHRNKNVFSSRLNWSTSTSLCLVCTAPSRPLNVAAAAYSPSMLLVTWQPPAQPRGPATDIVYVVTWNSFNKDGSRTEGRVETGTRLNKVASRSLQGHGGHDSSQHVLVSDLQPSRSYNIRVCIKRLWFDCYSITLYAGIYLCGSLQASFVFLSFVTLCLIFCALHHIVTVCVLEINDDGNDNWTALDYFSYCHN